MTAAGPSPDSAMSVNAALRAELAECDAALGALIPTLKTLLAGGRNTALSEDVVARVRGMMAEIARQLLHTQAQSAQPEDEAVYISDRREALTGRLLGNADLLRFLHGLAIEGQLSERLRVHNALDPVLSPLLQRLIASAETEIFELAMSVLAGQARFVEGWRRMKLPLNELPAGLFDAVLADYRKAAAEADSEAAEQGVASLRKAYGEGKCRTELIARLLGQLGDGDLSDALSIAQAGAAIFVSALSIAADQERDIVALSTNESQHLRMSLLLGAAGLSSQAAAEQLLVLHPDASLPDRIDQLSAESASAVLRANMSGGAE